MRTKERGRIVLEHHSNLTPERQSWREKILSENWDAPIVLTTMVQFLDSLFGAGTRRMHQMANCVIVFDEIQTLPIKCVHLFNNAMNLLAEQCNTTVVLCTATQPLLHKVSTEQGVIRLSEKHELVPDTKKLFERLKRAEIMDARRPGGGCTKRSPDSREKRFAARKVASSSSTPRNPHRRFMSSPQS
jgi:CRISPR-associated endonuclease/helicase Cas3